MHALAKILGVTAILVGASPALAGDCACVDWPPDRRMKEADQVFIGRAGQRSIVGNEEVQPFDVYQSIKGNVPSKYELRHPQDNLACERSFQNQELALVFVLKGRAPICNGNVDIDKLIPSLDAYLNQEGRPPTAPDLDALKVALAGRFGGMKKVKAIALASSLVGKTLHAKDTEVSFVASAAVASRGKKAPKTPEELPVVGGATHGALSFVTLRRPDGKATFVLVLREHGKLSVLEALERDLTIK